MLARFLRPAETARILLARPDVQARIAEECALRLSTEGAPAAVNRLLSLVKDGGTTPEIALRAINSILDRAGFVPPKAQDPLAPGDAPMQQKSSAQLHKILEDAQRVLSDRAVKVIDSRKNNAQPATCPPELQA